MTIELREVSRTIDGEPHIYKTSLSFRKGGFNVLLGTTLSGKTTLLRLMAGLEKPTTGEVWFDGSNVTGTPVQKRSVSMVYQQFINYPNFNVFDNIASPLKVAGVSKDKMRTRVQDIAALLKLDNYLKRSPAELSGGQQQRIAIARALVKNSRLVLLDEPLANLDYKLREELREEMPKLFEGSGATVVYTTTEPMEALMLGGHTATLKEGRVTQYLPTIDGYRQPANLDSAAVMSDPPVNTAQVYKSGDRIFLSDSVSWPAPEHLRQLGDQPLTVAIRPHHLDPDSARYDGVRIEATVNIAELSGSESVIHIDMDGYSWVSQTSGIHAMQSGQRAEFYLQPENCLYYDQSDQLIPVIPG